MMNIQDLQKELAQTIRMLEDAVLTDSHSLMYMLIGKLSKIQSLIDALDNTEMEWRNENEFI